MARGARGVFLVLAAADTLLAGAGRARQRWLTKPFLMPVLMAGSDRGSRRALALGGAGDMALLGTGDVAFTGGLACFLAATPPGSTPCGSAPAAGGCAPGLPWPCHISRRMAH